MIFGIIRDGVRSAFVRIVRYIVFAIIALLIFYIIGIFTNKKASALTFKGTIYDAFTNGGDASGSGLTGNGTRDNYFYLNTPKDYTAYDFVGFRINQFSTYFADLGYTNSCSGTYNSSTGRFSYGCSGNYGGSSYDSEAYTLIANAIWRVKTSNNSSDNFALPCWFSSEYEGTFICPVDKNSNLIGIDVMVKYSSLEPFSYNLGMSGLKFALNSDNTDIVVQQGQANVILQQTQDTLTNDTTTTSQANATSSLNTISGQFNDVLNGWGGQWSSLTHVVLEPINTILYAFDSGTTCTPITLTIPYLNDGQTITLPCMSSIYGQYFSGFITVFVMIIGGLYGYRTVMYILRTIKEVIDAENDKIEVIDL